MRTIDKKDIDKVLLKHVFENSNTGISLVDINGNILKVNKKMSIISDCTINELENSNIVDFVHVEDRYNVVDFLRKVQKDEIHSNIFEKRYLHKSEKEIIYNISSSIIKNENNKPTYLIFHIQDITTDRAKTELIKQNTELVKTKYPTKIKVSNN